MAQRSARLIARLVLGALALTAATASADPSAENADAGAKKRHGPTAAQMWRERQHLPYSPPRSAQAGRADDASSHAAQASDKVVDSGAKKRPPRTAAQMWRERQHLPDAK